VVCVGGGRRIVSLLTRFTYKTGRRREVWVQSGRLVSVQSGGEEREALRK
jgi:hypothetical protein